MGTKGDSRLAEQAVVLLREALTRIAALERRVDRLDAVSLDEAGRLDEVEGLRRELAQLRASFAGLVEP